MYCLAFPAPIILDLPILFHNKKRGVRLPYLFLDDSCLYSGDVRLLDEFEVP